MSTLVVNTQKFSKQLEQLILYNKLLIKIHNNSRSWKKYAHY